MIDKELRHAKGALTAFKRLRNLLETPCLVCPERGKGSCPVEQCGSDRKIIICKAKAAFIAACAAVELVSGRKVVIKKREVIFK
jgi:hypothetical protein